MDKAPAPNVEDLKPLIEKYLDIKGYVDRRKQALSEDLKPYIEPMMTIKNYLQAVFIQHGIKNMTVSGGTGYVERRVSYKVVDMGAFLKWIKLNGGWELTTIDVLGKEMDAFVSNQYEDYLERLAEEGPLNSQSQLQFEDFIPPGLTRDSGINFKVRKSSNEG
jgi:hypothetical protein